MTGLTVEVDNGRLSLLSRGQQLGTAIVPPGDCSLALHSDAAGTKATLGGQPVATVSGDERPQLTGIYSQLDSSIDDVRGLSFQARVDNRFESSPSAIKIAVIACSVLSFLVAMAAVRKLDLRAGRRSLRLTPSRWWEPTLRDVTVVAVLVIWWLIGAMTADDGIF